MSDRLALMAISKTIPAVGERIARNSAPYQLMSWLKRRPFPRCTVDSIAMRAHKRAVNWPLVLPLREAMYRSVPAHMVPKAKMNAKKFAALAFTPVDSVKKSTRFGHPMAMENPMNTTGAVIRKTLRASFLALSFFSWSSLSLRFCSSLLVFFLVLSLGSFPVSGSLGFLVGLFLLRLRMTTTRIRAAIAARMISPVPSNPVSGFMVSFLVYLV